VESMKKFEKNLDYYLRDNRGFKTVLITLSSLEPFALSGMLTATVSGKLGNLVNNILVSRVCF